MNQRAFPNPKSVMPMIEKPSMTNDASFDNRSQSGIYENSPIFIEEEERSYAMIGNAYDTMPPHSIIHPMNY